MDFKKRAGALALALMTAFAASCQKTETPVSETTSSQAETAEIPEISETADVPEIALTEADEPQKDEEAITEVFDYVLDIGTYTELDYAEAENLLSLLFDGHGGQGLCSAAAVIDENGEMLVGRNLDLVISENPVYIYRTKADGAYETVGLTYGIYGDSLASIKKDGLSDDMRKIIPFMANDVMNSEGLYIEMNMRYGEKNDKGRSKLGCSGTNPQSSERVCVLAVPQYVGQHCATVDEAVEYIRSLDIYSMNGSGINWNLCFMIADVSGNYGLLEMAGNEISWLPKQSVQTNVYVTESFAAEQDFKLGVGRYDLLNENIGGVRNADELFSLMNDVRGSLMYDPENSKYDVRSEYVSSQIGSYFAITYDQLMDEANAALVEEHIKTMHDRFSGQTREQKRKYEMEWESTYTLVANCAQRTIKVRFYEDDGLITTLSFDE